MLSSLAAAALAALAIVVSTRAVIVLQKKQELQTRTEFEKYKLDTGKQIAEASARQKEAELKLEELRAKVGPRHIDGEAFKKALEGKPKAPVEIMFPKEDGEAFLFSLAIRDVLRTARWQVSEPIPVPPTDVPRLKNMPSHMAAGAQAMGMALVVRADTQEDFRVVEQTFRLGDDPEPNTPLRALQIAFQKSLGALAGYAAGPDVFDAPPSGTIRGWPQTLGNGGDAACIAGSSPAMTSYRRHARPRAGHPRLLGRQNKTWMAGTSPAMTDLMCFPGAAQHAVVRCRPGIVANAVSVTIPDQRCTASRCTASGKHSSSPPDQVRP